MKAILKIALCCALFSLTACSQQAAVEEAIKIPIYENEAAVSTVKAEIMNLSNTQTVAASIGYPYADAIFSSVEGNLVSIDITKGQAFKEGDVLATIDSSALNFDLASQQIVTESAYQTYMQSGSKHDRIVYETEQLELELLQYQIDLYTIRAPYDCIITDNPRVEVGSVIENGTYLCSIAKEDEVFLFATDNTDLFKFGMNLQFRLNKEYFTATVVQEASSNSDRRSNSINNAVIIKFDDGQYEKMIEETPNAVSAGWATLYVTTADKRNVLAVPEDAVKNYGGSVYCNVLQNDQKIQVNVEVGETYQGYTEILSGLTEGDTLVL